jgi:hypothetical protein
MSDWSEHFIEIEKLLLRYGAAALARDWEKAKKLAAEIVAQATALEKTGN